MPDPLENIEASIQLLDRAFRDLHDKGVKWSELPNYETPFRNLCIEIMNAVAFEYHQLKIGAKKAPQFAAWAARNLLELKIHHRLRLDLPH